MLYLLYLLYLLYPCCTAVHQACCTAGAQRETVGVETVGGETGGGKTVGGETVGGEADGYRRRETVAIKR